MQADENQRVVQKFHEQENPSWSALVGRLILDITGVVEAEARLMRASIEPTLNSVLEQWLLQLVIAALAMVGSLILLAAVILLLHLWLAWWLSFAITGAATLIVALAMRAVISRKTAA